MLFIGDGFTEQVLNRNGLGFYTSLNPWSADRYTETSGEGNTRVVVLCSVAVPKAASSEPGAVDAVRSQIQFSAAVEALL